MQIAYFVTTVPAKLEETCDQNFKTVSYMSLRPHKYLFLLSYQRRHDENGTLKINCETAWIQKVWISNIEVFFIIPEKWFSTIFYSELNDSKNLAINYIIPLILMCREIMSTFYQPLRQELWKYHLNYWCFVWFKTN